MQIIRALLMVFLLTGQGKVTWSGLRHTCWSRFLPLPAALFLIVSWRPSAIVVPLLTRRNHRSSGLTKAQCGDTWEVFALGREEGWEAKTSWSQLGCLRWCSGVGQGHPKWAPGMNSDNNPALVLNTVHHRFAALPVSYNLCNLRIPGWKRTELSRIV